MQIELTTAIPLLASACAIYYSYKNSNRSSDKEIEERAREMATVNQKLDGIAQDTNDTKKIVTDTRSDVSKLSERVVIVEQSAKSAHHRLDGLEDDYPLRRQKKKSRW